MTSAQALLKENPWLRTFVGELAHRFPKIQQIYLFGSRVRGDARSDSDWDVAVYGGWDESLRMMCEIARHEEDIAPGFHLIDMYVEEDGPTFIAVWGAEVPRVLPKDMAGWQEGRDYLLLLGDSANAQLGARLKWRKESP